MPEVDPEVWQYLGGITDGPTPDLHTLSVAGARTMMDDLYAGGDGASVAGVAELTIPGAVEDTTIRIYTPEGEAPFPALAFFHGGGWALGDLETHDGLCRALATRADCVVVAVDYGRAPEHPFPTPLEDCYLATRWVVEHAGAIDVDPDRVAVGGDSAGGNLAAAVALLARDRDGPALQYQLLAYPVLDAALASPSYDANPGIMFSERDMAWCWDLYLADDVDAKNPYASPLAARDLSDLPPAQVITGDVDLLRGDGRRYAERLEDAGVPVEYLNVEGMVHAFLQFEGVGGTDAALESAAQGLRSALE